MEETKKKTRADKQSGKESGRFRQILKNLRAEFRKIIWPDRKTAAKETAAVISLSVCIGVIIGVLDTVIKYLVGIIV